MPSDTPRRFCCDEDLAKIGYDGDDAADDLELWREHGPRAETQELLDVILAEGVEGAALLDIGAGVGAVHVTLLEARRGVSGGRGRLDRRTSPPPGPRLSAAAWRSGSTIGYGDVVELADELPPADIVTADSVICCYPYLEPFLAAAVADRTADRGADLHPRHLVAAALDALLERGLDGAPLPGPMVRPSPPGGRSPHGARRATR